MKTSDFLRNGKRKTMQVCLSCLLFCIPPFLSAIAAVSVIDVNPADLNSITKIENEQWIYEDYNETHLVPYTSHDGWGIVNSNGGYFDKKVTFNDVTPNTSYFFHFYVTNTTPWNWSDYHFEFWDPTFTTRIKDIPLSSLQFPLYSDQFGNKGLVARDGVSGTVAEFWTTNQGDIHGIGEEGYYRIELDLYDFYNAPNGSFGLRQVATAVPEPGTYMLMGLGALLIGGFVLKNKKSSLPVG